MTFLVDAHLPRRLAHRLRTWGHEAIHTHDLARGNRTPDGEIEQIALREQAIVVTKDADFVNTFAVRRVPYKLLLVSTGNIKNVELDRLFEQHITDIAQAFESHDFVEITRTMLVSMCNLTRNSGSTDGQLTPGASPIPVAPA
jgi:predicted nuclease of predicted toxin-antitoxin system